jgi:hypothetical protein
MSARPASKQVAGAPATCLLAGLAETATCLLAGLAEMFSSTLKMEAICSSETSVASQQTTRRHIPEDDTLQCITYFSHHNLCV